MITRITAALLLIVFSSPLLLAKNIDLVTLPNRETVQLTIYNSEDLTLVRETRAVTLKQGKNRLQFSWANTLIDPTSVNLRPLEHRDEIELVDTVFPGQKGTALYWNIDSDFEGQVLLEVSYFTSGLTWNMDYVVVANPAETELHVRGFVRVFNQSGEEYDNSQVRLIVGKVNLVERIAELAKRSSGSSPPAMPRSSAMKYDALRNLTATAEPSGGLKVSDQKKKIVKDGIGEYFMFSVEGNETIPNGWSKRMQAIESKSAPNKIVYRMRNYQYGPRPVRFFIWNNDDDHGLGESPLPNGLVRVFRENPTGGLSYLGQQSLNYVPVQSDIEVNLGADDLVVYNRRANGTNRNNFSFDKNTRVNGWDQSQNWIESIRNYRSEPIQFELRLINEGDIEVTPEQETTLFDYRTTETKLAVPAQGKVDYLYQSVSHQGANAKQNRVRLK
ncbi:MAG: hypothetical protein ACI9HK_002770 [Pirellulaceae bacterium]|jgi:hypothetical protein